MLKDDKFNQELNEGAGDSEKQLKRKMAVVALVFLVATLLLLVLGLFYRLNMLTNELDLLKGQYESTEAARLRHKGEIKKLQSSATPTPKPIYKVYVNERFGFLIQYPKEIEIAIIEEKGSAKETRSGQENLLKLSEQIGGIGGSKDPEYRVVFYDNLNVPLFQVGIMIGSVESLGVVSEEGFTYSVKPVYREEMGRALYLKLESLTDEIQKNMILFASEKSVRCNWFPFYNYGLIEENEEKEVREVVYFNQELNQCVNGEIVVLGDDIGKPFETLGECSLLCD